MPTIQISKIQMRRGPAADLPNPSLDDGEFGFADDVGRLFIGQASPTNGQPNFNRVTFPYQNIEVFTENSPLGSLLQPVMSDDQEGFIAAVPLIITGSFTTLQTYDSTHTAQDFYVNLVAGSGANAQLSYFVFDNSNNPIRTGTMSILWNTLMVGPPLLTDEAEVAVGSLSDIAWRAVLTGSLGNQHVIIQYTNSTSDVLSVFFAIERPALS